MKRIRVLAAFLIVLTAALACNFPGGGGSPTEEVPPLQLTQPAVWELPPSTLPAATQAVPAVPPLTAEMIRNGTYKTPQLGQTVTLTNGKYDRATSNEDILHVALDPIALGDLNGDGAVDAAAVMSENSGGPGFLFSLLVVINQNGAPVQWTDRFLEDRAQVNGLTVQDGRIILDAVIHSVGDAMSSPNFRVLETFRLKDIKLILTHFISIPSGQQREILITAPLAPGSVSASIPLSGNVTILPFENTLAYAIFDAGKTKSRADRFR